jgi:iron-sulfur cluster repair protein YtfE (RIC family)
MATHDSASGAEASAQPRASADWTVNEVLARHPATLPVFNLFGVDTCCGGEAPLRDAALLARTDLPVLVRALETAAGGSLGGTSSGAA